MWTFNTQVKLDYTPSKEYEDRDVNVLTKHVYVKWVLDLELREWGVKSFYVSIPDQIISVEIEHVIYNDEHDVIDEFTETKELKINDEILEIDYDVPEMSEQMFSQMCPYELVFDKYFKQIRFCG